MRLEPRATVVPAPYVAPTTQQWDGDDGSWSTFVISVGTPGQSFRVLPSTAGSETWVPSDEGCTSDDPSDCAQVRGANPFNGNASPGFQANESKTWNEIGLYSLDLESAIGLNGSGLYGYDVVSLGAPSASDALAVNNSIVAATADKDYLLGILGLNVRPTSFSSSANNSLSFLEIAKNNGEIPSLSYGYTAGARYQQKGTFGNLVLGGYDQSRFTPSNQTIAFGDQNAKPLQVGVQSITADNTLYGTASFTQSDSGSSGFLAAIDSTVAELWMPESVCDIFATNLGLSYDNNTDLYYVNNTIHSRLQELNPTFTFKLGNTAYFNGEATNIEIPYAAFDLEASWPIYTSPQTYFPIRRSSDESQYILGRTLLQQAYIVVDYERQSFSVNQALFESPQPAAQIRTIQPLGGTSSNDDSSSSSLSGGAIAGIAIGAVAGIAIIGLIAWLLFRRRRKQQAKAAELEDTQLKNMEDEKREPEAGKVVGAAEVGDNQVHELGSQHGTKFPDTPGYPHTPVQEMSTENTLMPRQELETPPVRYEMDAGDVHIPKPPR